MKNQSLLIVFFFSVFFQQLSAQDTLVKPEKYTAHNKGKFYVFWGGNRGYFTDSDIHFTGDDHDFTIYDVASHDKPKGWHVDYISPGRMTIPQTNFRMGYFINDHYNISIGVDHMKYVMYQDRAVDINGSYPNEGSYGEALPNNQVFLTEEFLTFEHTDGLNYINSEFSRVDDISSWFKLPNTDKVQISLTEGVGAGVLYPKSNVQMFGEDRHDEFHIAGFGLDVKAGLNFTFFKYFFIQTELKGGYINMNDIRTTSDSRDRASQDFWFMETVIAFGGIFRI
ncbi:hypothetical protein [Flavobacterium sp.]|uniref:hypothetical protein n=1 Tax=Flavobacterium sp. TaxID=239 RepID=UPI0025BFBCAB|nr:hypothetical protein [Flavobacterium sp.]MBA4155486.1 hypothetical protein [Flavobacterium sp.]